MENTLDNRRGRRQRHGEPRLLEKQIRPEVIERCLQFLDIIINQIIYQENIYPSYLFTPRQMYHSLVYQCTDKNLSSYITLCVASLRDFFSQQLSDMISINILRNDQIPIVLRRYLIELHTIQDPCLRAIYDNTKQLMQQLDQIFAQCIQTIKQIKPLDNFNTNKRWAFQLRSCLDGRNPKGLTVGEVFRQKPIYKEFVLLNQQTDLLSTGKQSIVSSIKSLHAERLKLQFLCEDDKYEQEKFQQWNEYLADHSSTDQQETDTDIDDDQESFEDIEMPYSSNPSEFQSLTPTKHQPMSTIEEENKRKKRKQINNIDSDVLMDRYHFTQAICRENVDALQYLSDDEDLPDSPYSPENVRQEEEEEDEDL